MLVIGTMLMLTVPLRYVMRKRAIVLDDRGLLIGSAGYGAAVGGTVGAGVILLSVLMAAGLARRGGDRDRRGDLDRGRHRADSRCSALPARSRRRRSPSRC